jgi:hypothetical protein
MTRRRRIAPPLARKAKLVVRRCLEVVSDARVKRFWSECASVRSRSTLYALADEQRPHVPSVSQLLEMAAIAQAAAIRLSSSAAELTDIAAEMAKAHDAVGVAELRDSDPALLESTGTQRSMRKAG